MEKAQVKGQDIKCSLLRAIAWTNEQISNFAVPGALQSFSKSDVAQIKPISELALTVSILHRCGVRIPILPMIADWIWQQCQEGEFLVRLLLARPDFLPCCSLYAPLFQLGYKSDKLGAAIKLVARLDMATTLPIQPWFLLAVNYNLWKLKIRPSLNKSEGSLYVVKRPEPWVISNELAYAITHEVMYLTDFGFCRINKHINDYLRVWIPYWASIFIKIPDCDVAGEFAMISSCIENGPEIGGQIISSLLTLQNDDGSFPGPDGAGSFLFCASDSKTRRRFLNHYHTTLVMIMALALYLRARAATSISTIA